MKQQRRIAPAVVPGDPNGEHPPNEEGGAEQPHEEMIPPAANAAADGR